MVEEVLIKPKIYDQFINYFQKSIKHDDTVLQLLFFTCLSAYTGDPLNLFLKGDSSIGKSYITTNVIKVFPDDDVWLLGGISPKALIHQKGVTCSKQGIEIDFNTAPGKDASEEEKKEWRELMKDSYTLIDLRNKILVFLESPSLDTFMILRPLLSHDAFKIQHKFVDKTERGQLRTRTVVLMGWPATIFGTTSEKYFEELITRSMTVTPVMTNEKYKEANFTTADKFMFGKLQNGNGDLIEHFKLLLSDLKQSEYTDILVPYARALADSYPIGGARAMRDFSAYLRIMKASTWLNTNNRPVLENPQTNYKAILATAEDLDIVASLFGQIIEQTVLGSDSRLPKFLDQVCSVLPIDGFHVKEAVALWNKIFPNDKRGERSIRGWITGLELRNYLSVEPDPDDRRQNIITLLKTEKISANFGNAIISNCITAEKLKPFLDNIATRSEFVIRDSLKDQSETLSLDVLTTKLNHVAIISEVESTPVESKKDDIIALQQSAVISPVPPIPVLNDEKLAICKTCGAGPYRDETSVMAHLALKGFENHEITWHDATEVWKKYLDDEAKEE